MNRNALLLGAVISLMASPVFAQTTIGDRLQDMLATTSGPVLFLIAIACYAGGIVLMGLGLARLRVIGSQQATGVQHEGASTGILTILAGVFLLALPNVAGIGMNSVLGTGGIISGGDLNAAAIGLDTAGSSGADSISGRLAGMASVTAPVNCFTAAEPVSCMARNLAVNVVPIGIIAIFVTVFLFGLWGLGSALFEMAKPGHRGHGVPEGWWGKVIFSILLMNGPFFLMATTQTIMGDSGVIGSSGLQTGSSMLSYSIGGSGVLQRYEELIGYLFIILALFGAVAFVRGIFIMKAAGEGRNQNASVSHGLIFLIAGVLLVNAKATTCTVLHTVGADGPSGAALAFGFCS